MDKITEFKGDYRFLSNFYPSKLFLETPVGQIVFPTVEHAYQAAKSNSFEDWKSIAELPTPGLAKKAGRKVKLRENWIHTKFSVMEMLLIEKFKMPYLERLLLATGDAELIEGNTWGDVYWGVDLRTNLGGNNLGILLMNIREDIRIANSLKGKTQ